MIPLNEQSVVRRRLSGLLETQLRDLASDVGISEHVGAASEPSGIARTIVNYTKNSDDLWAQLLVEIDRIAPVRLQSDGTLTLTRHDEEKLLGLLRPYWVENKSWIKTAVVFSRGNMFLDRNLLPLKPDNLISHLAVVPSSNTSPTQLPLIRFVILLRDIATCKNDASLASDLLNWLKCIVHGSEYDSDSIASKTIPLPSEAVWEPALELAWKPDVTSKFPEAYLRWGDLRQKVEVHALEGSRRAQASAIFELIEADDCYKSIDIDHVEVSVTMDSIAEPWELKEKRLSQLSSQDRVRWPVTVRLCPSCETSTNRVRLECELDETRVNTSDDEVELATYSVTHGFFVALNHVENGMPSRAFCAAAKTATAAIWTRKKVSRFELIRDNLKAKRLYDLPKIIHNLRSTAGIDSDWQHLVLLYDPNLGPFEFSTSVSKTDHSSSISLYSEINNQL